MVVWATLHTFSQPVERQPVCPLPVLERWRAEPELQLARQRLESSESVCFRRKSFYFSPTIIYWESFVLLVVHSSHLTFFQSPRFLEIGQYIFYYLNF